MLLRGRQLGASEVGGIFRGFPPTPGTVASTLGVTAAPLGMSPRPMFTTPPMSIDYAFPTVPAVPTAAAQINQGMQPMGAPSGAGANSGGAGYDPNMPLQLLHGVPPNLAMPDPTSSASVFTPPPSDPPAASTQLALTPDQLLQLAPPKLVNLLNPWDPQRSLPAIAGVVGGGALLVVLLLRR